MFTHNHDQAAELLPFKSVSHFVDSTYFYCPLVFIESKVLWDNLFGVLINQEGNLPWMVGLRFGWTN